MQTYHLKITLDGIKPSIWRKLSVPSDITLDILHAVLQVTMGWEDAHSHQFTAGKLPYTPLEKEAGVSLDSLISNEGDKLRYLYDMDHHWQHTIKLEKVLPLTDGFPKCVGGERACPPEDCGGIPGYEQILHARSHPEDADSEELFQWIGEEYDPECFQPAAINEVLVDFAVIPQNEPERETLVVSARPKLSIVKNDVAPVKPDEDKIDDAVLALLTLTFHTENNIVKAWKTFDWDAMTRLHAKGYILDPVGKLKSVVLTDKGAAHAQQLFSQLFAK